MKIIGITGPAGAGKDVAAHYLSEKLEIPHQSGGDYLRAQLRALGLEPSKKALAGFGDFLRSNYGPTFIPERALRDYSSAPAVIYSGFRAAVVAEYIKSTGGVLLFIDAPQELRHTRILQRQRGGDAATREDLIRRDEDEETSRSNWERLDKVRDLADEVIINDQSLDDFYRKLDDVADLMLPAA